MKSLRILGLVASIALSGCVNKQGHDHKDTPIHDFSERERALVALEQEAPQWKDFITSLEKIKNRLSLSTNKHNYDLGEKIELSVEIPQPGYLNIMTVNAEGVGYLLFPNKLSINNKVESGIFTTKHLPFNLKATKPYGNSIIIAVVTQQAINLYTDATGKYNTDDSIISGLIIEESSEFKRLFEKQNRCCVEPSQWAGDTIITVQSENTLKE